jgi:Flp pilus assembly protein CpaB
VSSRRTLILVGAIVVGAIAALLILQYVGSIEDKANTDNQLVPVVIASGDIKAGEVADGLIEEQRITVGNRRRVDLPSNAVGRVEDIKGQSAAIDLNSGEIITTSKFTGSGASSASKSNVLEPGNVAISISVDQQRSVANLIQPGDFVNVIVATKPKPVPNANPADAPAENTDEINGAAYVFQKVKVLAIGQNVGTAVAAPADAGVTATTAPPTSDLVTLQVPPEVAPTIAAAADKAGIRLVLVRPDYQPRPVPNFFFGVEDTLPGELGFTPYEGQMTADGSKGGSR